MPFVKEKIEEISCILDPLCHGAKDNKELCPLM